VLGNIAAGRGGPTKKRGAGREYRRSAGRQSFRLSGDSAPYEITTKAAIFHHGTSTR
jgi:hypothetical protein